MLFVSHSLINNNLVKVGGSFCLSFMSGSVSYFFFVYLSLVFYLWVLFLSPLVFVFG